MSTKSTGDEAEVLVSSKLESYGHKIISRNWKNRYCEIDIVSKKDNTVYFTEVKYRSRDNWGGGLSYITPKKLKQMEFATEFWCSENNWSGDCILQGAELGKNGLVNIVEIE